MLKKFILQSAYRLSPFPLVGDGWFCPRDTSIKLSCIINFYGRLDLLAGILHSLVAQRYPRGYFEVILVEDRGGTAAGRDFCQSFAEELNIVYEPLDKNYGQMGYSRNFALARARGEYVLFLDDDTVILQEDFLQGIVSAFEKNPTVDALMPQGRAAYAQWPQQYAFHDPFFLTSRCSAYRRRTLEELKGFMSCFIGQEDVEFVMRFSLADKRAVCLPDLEYFHPPLVVANLKKPEAVGISFARLRGRYPLGFLWLVALNCSRHMPLLLSPRRHHREMGRFGLGFFMGFVKALTTKDATAHYGC
jgi:cellulose synthase/poly-beta-1,6-N-acetylglucosamine synthase-like glycosyltransferase